MASVGVVVSLVILFILIAIAITLSVIALVSATKNSSKTSFVVRKEVSNGALNRTYYITVPTYIFYDVGEDSTLIVSGRKGGMAYIKNGSESALVLVKAQSGTEFVHRRNGNTVTVTEIGVGAGTNLMLVWENGTTAIASVTNDN